VKDEPSKSGIKHLDGVADDLGRKAVTLVRIRNVFHSVTMPHQNASRHFNPLKRDDFRLDRKGIAKWRRI
jgi:hypothetical protein